MGRGEDVRQRQQATIRLTCERIDGALNLGSVVDAGRSQLHSKRRGRSGNRAHAPRRLRIIWIENDYGPHEAGLDLLEHFQPFAAHCVLEAGEPGDIPTWTRQTCNKAGTDWIGDVDE